MQPTEVALQVMAGIKDPFQSLAKAPSVPRLLRCAQRSALLQLLFFENPFFAQGDSQQSCQTVLFLLFFPSLNPVFD